MARSRQTKQKIEGPEGKSWQKWFSELSVKEHENYLSKMGLDKEDIAEWEEHEGIKKKKKK